MVASGLEPMARVGDSPVRLEDERLLTGRGQFLDDLRPEGCVHAVFVRSPHAHARIESIEIGRALAYPGVLDVFTAAQLDAAGVRDIWPNARENPFTGEPFVYDTMPILARRTVRYAGEPVACVVARSRDVAGDAAALVDVTYDPLPAVVDGRDALARNAPEISAAVPGNVCLDWTRGDESGVNRIFAEAAHVVSVQCLNHRIAAQPMECRGALAVFDAANNSYELTLASQNVHVMREHVMRSLSAGAPGSDAVDPVRTADADVRVIARDVGGGFGSRNFVYPEYVAVLFAAKRAGHPVKWSGTRIEGCTADHQSRDAHLDVSLALDGAGRFLAIKADALFAAGGYMTGVACGVPTGQYAAAPGSVYGIEHIYQRARVVLTNAVPIGVSRGPGFAETVDPIERLIDKAALECGFDRIALRRLNFISEEAMPWVNPVGTRIDSGDFEACLDRALHAADVEAFETRAAASKRRGCLRGFGVASHIKGTGGAPAENIRFEFEDDVLVFTTGTMAIGQGHETSFRQIIATLLGVSAGKVRYQAGDTELIPFGGGHGSSRATFMASQAMSYAAQAVIAKGKRIAANMFEADVRDIAFANGRFCVNGTDVEAALLEVARHARSVGTPLDTYQHYVRDELTWPNGCHVAEVEIDIDTGQVTLDRYTTADDHGVMVNPMLVRGQAHGAIMQGVAQALMEQVVFDTDGQPVTGSFLDYTMPRADDLPEFSLNFCPTRCTTNPLGVKGAGEPGAIAGFPAVANAIAHALGIAPDELRGAAGPQRIFSLLHARTGD